MMRVEQVIRRVKRDVVLMWALHIGLAAGVVAALTGGAMLGASPVLLAAIPCTLWVLMGINGVREMRSTMQWPALIAAGKLDEAEKQIERSIRGFGVLRSVKLLSLHQLAVVRMAQHQWREATELSRAILTHKLPKDQSLARASLLVLAGASVQSGEYAQAYDAILRLRAMQLTLDEQLSLLAAETVYCGRVGAWAALVTAVEEKCRLAELMPSELAAQVQAWLALGARRLGRHDWERYLVERCGLLCDVNKLCTDEPALRELWTVPQQDKPTNGDVSNL